MTIEIDFMATLWTSVKAHCPICHKIFTGWYCPSCGLPKKNSKYAIYKGYKDSIHNCVKYHFRPEFSQFEDFQLCEKCYSTNPSNAKYCRNCSEKISSSKGIAKNAHGWIDLGLSVLWATETIEGLFYWGDCSILNHSTNISDFEKNRRNKKCYLDSEEENAGYDVATQLWGVRWRTPTKEELEELATKCKWEKCVFPNSNKFALKIIGPNGNHITIPVTGFAGCNEVVKPSKGPWDFKISRANSEAEHSVCALWSSSKYTIKGDRAYAFYYIGYKGFTKTLTEREKKQIEFENANYKRKMDHFLSRLGSFHVESLEETMQKTKDERIREQEERDILRNIGDDSQERANNLIKDMKRRRDLWLNTPIEMRFNEERLYKNTIRPFGTNNGYAILPVADKKWQGKL